MGIFKSHRSNTQYQSRLTRRIERYFDFDLEHIAGSKMVFVYYLSKNSSHKPSKYDEEIERTQLELMKTDMREKLKKHAQNSTPEYSE